MAEDGTSTAHGDVSAEALATAEARRMLDTFASVGATRFEVTWTDLARTMPEILDRAARRHHNVIVRPEGPGVSFIQLDDLTAEKLAPLAPAMFLIIETSPGSFQAWLAMPGKHDKEFARRVRRGAGADLSASGATRIAGSFNFKDKYAPDFPRVMIRAAQPGRMANADELDRLGLVAPPDNFAPLPPAPSISTRAWPSYAISLDGAPLNREGDGPDRSRADFVWCMTAITRGFGIEETAEQLLEESTKAREYGRDYAHMTARNAALAVERRRQQPRRHLAEHGQR
jgi:RepB DNA-primase from phage plasmid